LSTAACFYWKDDGLGARSAWVRAWHGGCARRNLQQFYGAQFSGADNPLHDTLFF
jgi:hypothetical protein